MKGVALFVFVGFIWDFASPSVQGILEFPSSQKWYLSPVSNPTVQYTIRNVLKEPTFTLTQAVPLTPGEVFQKVMEKAATADSRFRFSSDYYNTALGYFINTIHSVKASGNTYWKIHDSNNQSLNLGVSSYKPSPGEHLTFNLTVW